MKRHQQIEFVERFLTGLINLPRGLRKNYLVYIDEAHLFCPESGKGGKTASRQAVIDLLSRGRKRGLCGILATQRLAKLNKDATAECNVRLFGRITERTDMKIAGEILGMERGDYHKLKNLQPGYFYGSGPAIEDYIVETFKVSEVETTHPEPGSKIEVPKASEAMKMLLENMKDLPEEAEAEIIDIEDFRTENIKLKRENSLLRKEKEKIPGVDSEEVSKLKQDNITYRSIVQKYSKVIAQLKSLIVTRNNAMPEILKIVGKVRDIFSDNMNDIAEDIAKLFISVDVDEELKKLETGLPGILEESPQSTNLTNAKRIIKKEQVIRPAVLTNPDINISDVTEKKVPKCARAILEYLACFEDRQPEAKVAAMTGYRKGSGNWSNSISTLRGIGVVTKEGTYLSLNEGYQAVLIKLSINPDPNKFSLEFWLNSTKISLAARKILRFLVDNPDHIWTKNQLGEYTDYEASGGNFANALSSLTSRELVVKTTEGYQLNPEFAE